MHPPTPMRGEGEPSPTELRPPIRPHTLVGEGRVLKGGLAVRMTVASEDG